MTKPLPPSKLVDIDLVQPNPGNVRRTKTDPAADDAFKESLRLQGQLQPVLVQPRTDDMPPENPDKPAKFQVVFGGRRLRLMREIGAKKISVIEADGISAANATAVSAIENMQRAAMHPVDIWTAMVTLQAALSPSGTLGTTDIAIAFDHKATCLASNVTITVV